MGKRDGWRAGRAAASVLLVVLLLAGGPSPLPADDGSSLITLPGGETLELVLLPGGSFPMGSEDGDPDEAPVREVFLPPFLLGRTEVTQAQWRAVAGDSPAHFGGCGSCPVENVSWEDAAAFLERLSRLAGRPFRLPTEAEWEFAAGAGGLHRRWAGTDAAPDLAGYAWIRPGAGGRTHPAGEKLPNAVGLLDMTGNVWEWCADWYGRDAYAVLPALAPDGPTEGTLRTVRGGAWPNQPDTARITTRLGYDPGTRLPLIGLRVALDAP
jgi:formylglycine-generating enzyme required for sulfatase activity